MDSSFCRRNTRAAIAIACAVAMLTVGCGPKETETTGKGKATKGAKSAGLDRAQLGAEKPSVDIIAFVGFQCAHCKKSADALLQLATTHSKDVRLRIVNLPLDVHADSVALAKGFVAARMQGKWQAYYKHIFSLPKATADDVVKWAAGAGIDAAKFKKDLASKAVADEVGVDAGIAGALGVAGTPSYLVNGALLQGARAAEEWKSIIDGQKALAAKKTKDGVKAADLMRTLAKANSPKRAPHYARIVLKGELPAAATVPVKTKKRKSGVVAAKLLPAGGSGGGTVQLGGAAAKDTGIDRNTVWRVIVRPDDPVRGAKDAPLTVVVFSDYECKFSKQLQPTLKALEGEFGKDLRIVHKHNPLPFHQRAMAAAEAAEAARAQGQFWKMHDALFAAAPALQDTDLSKLAADIKLDKAGYDNAMSAHGAQRRVRSDVEQAAAVGARGTPNLFINGMKVVGAKTKADLMPLMRSQLAAAKKMIAGGTPAATVYDKIVGQGRLLSSLSAKAATIATLGAATRGPKGAAIHIVAFEDFQCPFCARLDQHIAAMEREFDGRVKVTWMDFPLSKIHPQAQMAAEAGKEALAQGKFWQFHAAVMADQHDLTEPGLLILAKKAGVDTKKLRAALKSHKWAADVAKERAEGQKLALKGTPSVFINGYAFTPQLGFSANTFRSAIVRLLGAR
ncbi:MAG: thioredoxin domain-containing protein [Myxococcales bacterium]|nr:thioredoxin domain-containing protein [Myxococcales bacterium]